MNLDRSIVSSKTRTMTWQPWTLCLLWLSLLWPPDAAAVPPASLAEGEVLIVDKVFDRLAPAMFRRPFQRMPEEKSIWVCSKARASLSMSAR